MWQSQLLCHLGWTYTRPEASAVLATRPSTPQTADFALKFLWTYIIDILAPSELSITTRLYATQSHNQRFSSRRDRRFFTTDRELQKFRAQIAAAARTAALGRRRFQPEIAAARQPTRAERQRKRLPEPTQRPAG